MDKISVIVPIYNVENYLVKCVQSIQNQTYKNLEIILVNDGSTDNSGNFCKELAENDNRIKVITKENGGLSSARNAGIAEATGEYICFIDSDDYIEQNYCELLYNALIRTNSDVAAIDYVEVLEDDVQIINAHETNKNNTTDKYIIYEGINIIKEILNRRTFKNVVWNKLYKLDLIKKHLFLDKVNYEDMYFSFDVLRDINRIVFINQVGYFYIRRKGSICYNPSEKNLCDFLKIAEYRFETIKSQDLKIDNYNFYALIDVVISISIKYLYSDIKYDSVDSKIKYLVEKIVKYTDNCEMDILFLLSDFQKACLYLMRYDMKLFNSFLKERQQKMFYILHKK